MADKTNKTKPKRFSKGGRAHVRRLKAEARKAGTTPNLPARSARPVKVPKKEIES